MDRTANGDVVAAVTSLLAAAKQCCGSVVTLFESTGSEYVRIRIHLKMLNYLKFKAFTMKLMIYFQHIFCQFICTYIKFIFGLFPFQIRTIYSDPDPSKKAFILSRSRSDPQHWRDVPSGGRLVAVAFGGILLLDA